MVRRADKDMIVTDGSFHYTHIYTNNKHAHYTGPHGEAQRHDEQAEKEEVLAGAFIVVFMGRTGLGKVVQLSRFRIG